MRILMLNYEYPPLGGGGGVAAANLAAEFARKGHDVDYVTSHFAGLAREETVDGVRLWREPVIGRTGLQTASIVSMLSFPLAAVRRALALRRRGDFDVIHTHFAIPTGPAGYLLSKWWGRPNILSVYGGDIYDPSKKYSPHRHPVLKQAVKAVLNQASVVVGESEDLCGRARTIFRPRTEVLRIPLGFRLPEYAPVDRDALGMDPDAVYAVAVSRLVARKGYPDLLQALAQCGVPGLRLVIVGDGPEEPRLRQLAGELGLGSRVLFAGHVDEARKYQYLAASDFFALATHHEGFGIVYQEAMWCGLPVVTTNVGGQTDFLVHGENALLCDPADPATFAAHLRQMAENPALRARLGARNRADIQGHLIGAVADRYLDLFGDCRRRR
ncbi:MAG: glycosyltransferase family 4 protein [Candidatus Hydrogenedens sp.]|nr:glycosyltransferase family 4 protein [Candidatus Hydrogenedentota bacterium]NLF57723.1 glycosyltransferase family 4 protein [Candidatus Hydrogenedens sp.]